MASKNGVQWMSIKPRFVQFDDIGDDVEGRLTAVDYVEMKTGACPKYTLDTGEEMVSFLGTVQMVEAFSKVRYGTMVRVEYTGEVKTGQGFKVKEFNVLVEEGAELRTAPALDPFPDELPLPGEPA